MIAFSIHLGLALTAGLFLLGQRPASEAGQSGVFVEVKESEAPGAPVTERWKLYGASHALVIGIDEYSGNWPRLANAVKDARQVAEALQERGFEVTLETNLTSIELRRALTHFYAFKGADPEARLLVWFAGHGFSNNGEGYLVPSDAGSPGKPNFYARAFPMRDFGSLVRLARAKHALAIFDSCFAGTVFSAQRSLPPAAVTQATKRPVRQFLTSGDAEQQVADDGTFSSLFIDALDGEELADANGDGYLTGAELGFFLEDRLTNLTQGHQTPRSGKLRDRRFDQGDFVFVLPKARAALARDQMHESQRDGASKADLDLAFWDAVKDSKEPDDYRAYLEAYPNGNFAPLARSREKRLQN